jgi:hypothetical protein
MYNMDFLLLLVLLLCLLVGASNWGMIAVVRPSRVTVRLAVLYAADECSKPTVVDLLHCRYWPDNPRIKMGIVPGRYGNMQGAKKLW